jgi:uncharacterized membrane protein YcaP (DUF421 family)
MFILLIRTVILYILVVIVLRLMGKRQIGELQPYELVITIMISELASLPMGDTRIPLMHGFIPIITLLILQVCISLLELKSEKAHTLLDGKPNLVIKNGKLQTAVLKSQIFTVRDLMEELRINGYFNINEIEYAILETNGQLSVIPKSDVSPVTRKDLNVKASEATLPVLLILEGKVLAENLKFIGKDRKWLDNILKKNNIKDINEVFIGHMDTNSNFIYQYKEKVKDDKGEINL